VTAPAAVFRAEAVSAGDNSSSRPPAVSGPPLRRFVPVVYPSVLNSALLLACRADASSPPDEVGEYDSH